MPDHENPYRSPALAADEETERPPPPPGVWRDGPFVVMSRGAELPPYCIFTGEPATGWDEMRLRHAKSSWGESSVLSLPMGDTQRAVNRCAIGVWTVLTAAVLVIVALRVSGLLETYRQALHLSLVVAFASMIALVVLKVLERQVVVEDISPTHVWLNGADPSFLSRLPNLPE